MKYKKALKILEDYKNNILSYKKKECIDEILRNITLTDSELVLLNDYVLSLNDNILSTKVAGLWWADFHKHEQVVLDSEDPEISNYFVSLYKDKSNIEKHRKIVLEKGDASLIFIFLEDNLNCKNDIVNHGRAIAKTKDLYYNYLFSQIYEDKIDVSLNEQVLLLYGSPIDNLEYIKKVHSSNIYKHKMLILNSDSIEANLKYPLYMDCSFEEAKEHYDRAITLIFNKELSKEEEARYARLFNKLQRKLEYGYYHGNNLRYLRKNS